ncbi:MAG TPA: Crp/Fnr family transcriptional regulator [Hyphomonadaceae bacterium]|nr:Crp/Fnr family transcriptional regulator [Hyphomonadaceae bacterium]
MCISGGNIIDFKRSANGWGANEGLRNVRQFAAQQHLFFEGDARTHVFVIESGWVKVYRTLIDGQRQVVGFCNGGSVLGFEGSDEHANACQAVTDVKVRAIPFSRIGDICARDPDLGGQLLRQMGRQLGTAQAQLTAVGLQSADQKLATFLVAFADYGADERGEFDLPMRRTDMAEFLGLRLETVSRKLSDFQQRKWVKMVSLYRCQILNRAALEALAEGGGEDDRVGARLN